MNILGRTLIPLFLTASMLASCNGFRSTPTMSPADIMETAVATVSTAVAQTQRAIPTATPGLLSLPTVSFLTTPSTPIPLPASPTPLPTIPTFTPLAFTDPSIPLSERIAYYYVVQPAENPIPEGTVHAIHHFAPGYTDETFTSDTAADLRRALEIILHEDSRRIWYSSDLEIVDVTFRNRHADVVLQGEYLAAGDAQPCAASLQILMTVFANPSVQTASVAINGHAIGGLCIFRRGDPPIIQMVDNVYARAEIETYMKENAYVAPGNEIDPPSPYGEHTVTIGQVLVFPDFSLVVLDIDVRDAQKFANFHFVGFSANTGIVGEGETQFRDLSQLGGTSADHFSAGDGLIVGVSSITDEGIVATFDRYQAREVVFTETPSVVYVLRLGDILRLPFGTLQLITVTNFLTGRALFIANGSQAGDLIQLRQGFPIDHPNLSAVEFGPIQILREGISFEANLR